MPWQNFVALGDSFTEGVGDPGPDGHYRGWADRVAEVLAAATPGFRYANLAVRGRLLGQILDEQLPVALEMRPELVSVCGGVNDLLRRQVDVDALGSRLADAVAALRGAGSDVVLFVGIDPTARSRWLGRIRPRVMALNQAVRAVADTYGCYAVDMWGAAVFRDPRLWSPDRLHLSSLGHARTAGAVLETLGVRPSLASTTPSGAADGVPRTPVPRESPTPGRPSSPTSVAGSDESVAGWREPLPGGEFSPWLAARRDDVRWAVQFVGPWILRRLRGRSSGDGRTAKRPRLEELDVPS